MLRPDFVEKIRANLGLEVVNAAADIGDLIAALLLRLIRGLQGCELVFDVGDGFASSSKALLRSVVLLALKGMDLDLELKLATLQLVDLLRSCLAGNAHAGKGTLARESRKETATAYLAQASSTKSMAESGRRLEVR